MKKQIGIIVAMWMLASAFVHADTSFFLVQGPFGSGGATETFKWEVNYPTGALVTTQDLMNAIFGTPALSGTLQGDYTFGQVPLYSSGNSQTGATYVYYPPSSYFPAPSFFTYSLTLGSTKVSTNDSVNIGESTLGWNFYDDGGDQAATGSWNQSWEGQSGRNLANNSFDAWVFGDTGYDPGGATVGSTATITGAGNDPVAADFTNATVINVPEPDSIALLAAGAALAGVCFFTKKRFA